MNDVDSELTNDAIGTSDITIPVVEERLQLGVREIETGRLRVRKEIVSESETVPVRLLDRNYRIDRVPVNAVVSDMPVPRQEGETWVIPVVEETWVLQKRLVLTEEIRIESIVSERIEDVPVVLRKEKVSVERESPETPPTVQASSNATEKEIRDGY